MAKDTSLKTLLIQEALRERGHYAGEIDDEWGPQTQAAFDAFLATQADTDWRAVKASSFADPADMRAFNACKRRGGTDQACFRVGDNGIGKWGHKTAQTTVPMAAIPRDIWMAAGKTGGDPLEVKYRKQVVRGILGDTLPTTTNIHNGAGIDLNPAFAKAFGIDPPFMVAVEWRWL